ncbi:hypothetical protein [Terrabacter sp. 2RAF25]|uniref:hypothetical protein n=1 Tax=Terrabacter sp. 2RAF25 TaxID=3232998 RepID=UPI003F9697D4
MNTHDREHELQTLLRQEADRVEVPGDFGPVAIAKHRRDQRNRALVGAVVAVTAIAIAVPNLWSGRGSGPVPAHPTASPSPTGWFSSAWTRSNTYAVDDTIRAADVVVHLRKGTVVESFAVLANGGFVLQSHLSTPNAGTDLEILRPDGKTVRALGEGGAYVVSPEATRVLVKSGTSNAVTVYAADGTVVAQRQDPREAGAVVGDVAYLNGDETQGSLEWNLSTGAARKLPAHVVAVSADRTRAALSWTVASDTFEDFCWAVVDLTRPGFPKTIERCGQKGNPSMFQPTAFSSRGTYLVGSHYVDGGFWFSAGVVRVSDGRVVVGGDQAHLVSGWSWHLEADESTFVISRNTSTPVSPATRNTLQRCTLAMACTQAQPPLAVKDPNGFTEPRYVVPR